MRSRLVVSTAVASLACLALAADAGAEHPSLISGLTPVPAANPKAPGLTTPDLLSPELQETIRAQGSFRLENPDPAIGWYGYDSNGPLVPLPSAPSTEARKSEPDKNTYLVRGGLKGADPNYDYGSHFLFQGHEAGSGYITRINLDADGPHRVTLLATKDTGGNALPDIDGSTWDPFSQRLLFSSEAGNQGGIWEASLDFPAPVRNLQPFIGRGGFEAMQNDSDGNLWFIEDVGGQTGTGANSTARRPNSYLYRFVPRDPSDLGQGGKVEALQVVDTTAARSHGAPT